MELCEQAQATCSNFVREVETDKFPREIVDNVLTYRDFIRHNGWGPTPFPTG